MMPLGILRKDVYGSVIETNAYHKTALNFKERERDRDSEKKKDGAKEQRQHRISVMILVYLSVCSLL